MKFKYKIIEGIIVAVSLVTLIFTSINILINVNTSAANVITHEDKKQIDNIISNIKEENKSLKLVYESNKIDKFYNLTYIENNKYKTILIDKESGNILSFQDIIKDFKKFETKEIELLSKKYPEFIVNTIKKGGGYKSYFIKDNLLIIYYYDYKFPENYKANLSLSINYQEIKNNLNFKPILDKQYQNESGFNYSKKKKSVALTFDDGPSREYNSLILKELEKNKAHATFFMVGTMMESCGSCVLETYKSGNEVASHTYEHMNIKNKSNKEVRDSLNKVNKIYYNLTGDTIKYLRPPYGSYSKRNLEDATVPFILWNLDTEDWRYKNADHIVNYIINNVSDGSIILMHELYDTSYEALKIVLPKLYRMGYQVVSISDLAKIKNQKLETGKCYVSFK